MISNEYKNTLISLNGVNNFGKRVKVPKFLEEVILSTKPKSILDFGCGVGNLVNTLKKKYPLITVDGYDPGSKLYSVMPDKHYDLILSTDVLEHIEPEHIDTTLKMLSAKSKNFYHLIALLPSSLILPDGRNAHLILETDRWWKNKFIQTGAIIQKNYRMKHDKIDKNGQLKHVDKFFISGKNLFRSTNESN